MRKVHLLCMPFQTVHLAPLSVALLGSVLRRAGVEVAESYLHLDFAELVGLRSYSLVTEGGMSAGFAGELLFAEAYWGGLPAEANERVESIFGPPAERKRAIEELGRRCLARLAEVDADLLALTTSSNQLMASLWLARLAKHASPRVRVVLGGAACSVPMGARLRRAYTEVDHVVSGPGEEPLLRLARGAPAGGVIASTDPVDLDALPIPDYDSFLRDFSASAWRSVPVRLEFESSRGCWWGQKTHCAFCGLNQIGIRFNAKSEDRTIEEIRTLWGRYHCDLFATDAIMPRSHFKRVLPALASPAAGPAIFYEVKSNMSSAEVGALRAANVTWIQPGIESLSTPLLQRLGKGAAAIQNVALLKWCRERRIKVSWNLLHAIPGEEPSDYESQLALIASAPQLPPPQGVSPVRIDRYSPYFADFSRYGWTSIEPAREYRWLHPGMDPDARRDVAYCFDAVGPELPSFAAASRLREAVTRWQAGHDRGHGLFLDGRSKLVRIDEGGAAVLSGGERLSAILDRSHDVVGVEALMGATGCALRDISELEQLGVLFREGEKVVNLAVRLPQEGTQVGTADAGDARARRP